MPDYDHVDISRQGVTDVMNVAHYEECNLLVYILNPEVFSEISIEFEGRGGDR